jgi:hypothetical protein
MGEDTRLTASVNEEYFVRVDAIVPKNLGADGGRQPAMRQGEGGERQKEAASNHLAVTLPVIPASKWPGIRQAKPISPDLSNVQIISPVLPGSTWTM